MDLYALLLRAPVNKLAAAVVSQRRVARDDMPLTRDELSYLFARLQRKHRLLKQVLGIRTPAQHRNLTYKHVRRIQQFRQQKEPRAFREYIEVGQNMQRLIQELAAIKRARHSERNGAHD